MAIREADGMGETSTGPTAEQAAWAEQLGLGLAARRFPDDVAAAMASAERTRASLMELAPSEHPKGTRQVTWGNP
jgi:hypothetical protein